MNGQMGLTSIDPRTPKNSPNISLTNRILTSPATII